MPNQELTRVFHALTDPTRRAVLERLTRGPAAVKELAQPFNMALPSFVQHLGVLEGCGLVRSAKQGRVRTYPLAPQPRALVEAYAGLASRPDVNVPALYNELCQEAVEISFNALAQGEQPPIYAGF